VCIYCVFRSLSILCFFLFGACQWYTYSVRRVLHHKSSKITLHPLGMFNFSILSWVYNSDDVQILLDQIRNNS
jgi:hypothetical protein